MDSIVSSNVCPILTDEFIEDSRALERLNDTPARPLFNLGLDAVRRLKSEDASNNRLYELADIISIIHQRELTQPTEELLRDILPEQLIGGLKAAASQVVDVSVDQLLVWRLGYE